MWVLWLKLAQRAVDPLKQLKLRLPPLAAMTAAESEIKKGMNCNMLSLTL
jgi:hypothetical protein